MSYKVHIYVIIRNRIKSKGKQLTSAPFPEPEKNVLLVLYSPDRIYLSRNAASLVTASLTVLGVSRMLKG